MQGSPHARESSSLQKRDRERKCLFKRKKSFWLPAKRQVYSAAKIENFRTENRTLLNFQKKESLLTIQFAVHKVAIAAPAESDELSN